MLRIGFHKTLLQPSKILSVKEDLFIFVLTFLIQKEFF
jgi:hypothetical protein